MFLNHKKCFFCKQSVTCNAFPSRQVCRERRAHRHAGCLGQLRALYSKVALGAQDPKPDLESDPKPDL